MSAGDSQRSKAGKVAARKCKGCGGEFPILCIGASGPLNGYWHLDCARKARAKEAQRGK